MSFLTGKVVLITGAGKGVGRRLAEALAARGATLAVNDLTPINLDETVARIAAAGGQVQPYLADIAKKLPVQGLLNRVLDDFSRLDVLVNCAQVEPRKSVYEMDEWDWQRTLDVNLTGAFLLTQSAGRIMKEKGGGTIVHLGVRPGGPGPDEGRAAYLAAKAGLEALVKAAANEFAQFGVCVYHVVTAEAALEVIEP
jgi:NAD(P)-dependent dehydrogenase (short-subunit alcohol dehydrogenase family)